MLIVGPEGPLVNGIYDFFHEDEKLHHITVIGPSKKGAQLEGSKEFSKEFMIKHGIPTAAYQSFTKDTLEEGYQFLETLSRSICSKGRWISCRKRSIDPRNIGRSENPLLKEMLSQMLNLEMQVVK